ncbi:MAG: peroxiredoxin family protein [Candidatus Rokubacteria bacterium]|nr:peroxiredoxin family protein [Candidatus Rokubacteria bacterium]
MIVRLVLSLALIVASSVGATGPPASAAAPAVPLEDRLWDLQITPLDPAPAPPFTLPALDGGRLSLSDLRGRVVMLSSG